MIETALQNNPRVSVAVVSRPGIMQQSLRASLAACRGIGGSHFGDGLTALRRLAGSVTGMLVIDSNLLDEEVEALLAAAKVRHPGIRCLVLAQSRTRTQFIVGRGCGLLRDDSARNCNPPWPGWRKTRFGPQA